VQPARPKEGKSFAGQFKRNAAVLYPVWILPPVAGVYLSIVRFSWPVLALTILFCLHGFVILPIVSQQHNCKHCDNTDCPRWRGK
jgi:hypothetical protein